MKVLQQIAGWLWTAISWPREDLEWLIAILPDRCDILKVDKRKITVRVFHDLAVGDSIVKYECTRSFHRFDRPVPVTSSGGFVPPESPKSVTSFDVCSCPMDRSRNPFTISIRHANGCGAIVREKIRTVPVPVLPKKTLKKPTKPRVRKPPKGTPLPGQVGLHFRREEPKAQT
jgi:hypothetical protein